MEHAIATSAPQKKEVALISPFVPEFQLSPQKRDRFFQEMLLVLQLTQQWKLSLPLMEWMNRQDVSLAGSVAAGEVGEAVEELKANRPEKFAMEWIDTVTVPASWLLTFLNVDLKTDVLPHVNGQGRKSKVFKRAVEVAGNFSPVEQKLNHDVAEYLKLMFSSLIHAPRFSANLVNLTLDKLEDNITNYPQELFGVNDAHGKPLSSDMREAKYVHVMKCLKWLRSLQPGRLLPADWHVVKSEILAFQSSDEAFRMLQTRWFELHPETHTILVP